MAMLGHMVYFTLKDKSPEATEHLKAECKKYLSDLPGIVFFGVGTRDPELSRDVNDREFDVALQMVFESREAHDRYQVHQKHLDYIEANKDNWEKVRAFDANL